MNRPQSGQNWTTMTTKTIPVYLEDERQKGRDTQLRTEEEAARIQPLRQGHHRTAKHPKREKLRQQLGKSHASRERRRRKPARWHDRCAAGIANAQNG